MWPSGWELGLGIVVGLLYALFLPRTGRSPVAGGLVAGAILYVLGFWALPLLFPAWLAPFRMPLAETALEAVLHAFYGWVFGASYARLSRASGGVRHGRVDPRR